MTALPLDLIVARERDRLRKINKDLLAALIDLRLAATAHGVAHDNPANVKARAAIAKARGES